MKYIFKFMFHRIFFVILAMLAQLFVLVSVLMKFYDYFAFFYVGSIILSIVVIFIILNNKSNPVYKIAWIILILLFPIFGGIFYIFFGANKLSKRERLRMKSIEDKTKEALKPKPLILEEMKLHNEIAATQSKYIQDYAYYPPYCNSTSSIFP